ncbi:MAG TPA: hypothetical protein DDX39_02305 [Bacteroidales bacterium]|nr:hypothetical protein [Bacteroidales bacterium]
MIIRTKAEFIKMNLNLLNMNAFRTIISIAIIFIFTASSIAQERFWVNGSGNWNDQSHWSIQSGGVGDASIPTKLNDVIFDENSFFSDGNVVDFETNIECKSFVWNSRNNYLLSSVENSLSIFGKKFYSESNTFAEFFGTIAFKNISDELRFSVGGTISGSILFENCNSISIDKNLTVYGYIQNLNSTINNNSTIQCKTYYTDTENDFNISASQVINSTELVNNSSDRAVFSISLLSTTPSCPGLDNGTITIDISGSPTYPVILRLYHATLCPFATPCVLDTLDAVDFPHTITGVEGSATGYSVRVTDGDASSKTINNIGVVNQSPMEINQDLMVEPLCSGNSNGKIYLIDIGNATYPVNYVWTGGTTGVADIGDSVKIENIPSGNYFVTIVDDNGCETEFEYNLGEPIVLTASISSANITCNGDNDGTASASGTGGITPYTYEWSPGGDITQNISGLSAGTYYVTVFDQNNCQAVDSVDVIEPDAISLLMSKTDETCGGACDGTATATPSGGTTPYSWLWGGGQATQTISSLCENTYNVTVSDANGCDVNSSIDIDAPASVVINITSQTNIRCYGETNGAINITASGGTPGYTYDWGSGVTDEDRINLTAGIYTVTIYDSHSCSESLPITITQPDSLIVSTAGTDPTCNNGANGEITATPTGGTSPFTYSWSCTGQTSQTITGLSAGACTVIVTDDSLCTATETEMLDNPPALNIVVSKTPVTCNGDCDGTATLAPSGGTSPYTYEWDDLQTAQMATGLCVGLHSYTVTDNNGAGCSTTGSVNILGPTAISVNITSADVSCFGDCDGTATAVASGGNGGFSYIWCNGQTLQTATGLCAGTCDVTATDILGCEGNATATINEPDEIVITETITNVSCAGDTDGEISISMTGGSTPYTYFWYTISGGTGILPFNQNQTGLSEGTFVVNVEDASGCIAKDTFEVSHNSSLPPATVDVTDVLCNGESTGSINVTLIGATSPTYSWLPGGETTQDLNNIPDGNYCVHIEDNGCAFDTCLIVAEPIALSLVTTPTNPGCSGICDGSIVASPSGGVTPYSYDWSPNGPPYTGDGSNTYSDLCDGTYNVTVSDVNGCEITGSETLVEPGGMSFNPLVSDPLCMGSSDGSIELNVSGGITPRTYIWSPDGETTEDISGKPAGNYCVTVTDAGGCPKDTCITLTDPAGMDVSVGTPSAFLIDASTEIEVCFTATHTYVSDLGYYLIAPDGTTLELSKAPVTACNSDHNVEDLCFSTTEVTPLNVCNTSLPTPLTGNFASSNSWNIFYGMEPGQGNWAVQIYDCYGADIGFLTHATMRFTGNTVNGSVTYFYDSGVIASNINDNSCDALLASIFKAPVNFQVSCFGDCDATIFANTTNGVAPYTYEWDDALSSTNDTLYNLCVGIYNVTVTDDNGCQGTSVATITEPLPLTSGISSTIEICSGLCDGTATVNPSGGTPPYSILWNDNQTTTTATGLCSGVYTVTITDSRLCTFDTTITIGVNNAIVVTETKVNPTCYYDTDGSVTLNVSGGTTPYSIEWWNGNTSNSASGLSGGSYCYTVTDDNGCFIENCAVLTAPDTIRFNATVSELECYGDNDGQISILVTGGIGIPTYTWNPNVSVTNTASSLGGGTYEFIYTDGNGCTKDTIIILNEPSEITFDVTLQFQTCPSTCDGYAEIGNISGGNSPYNIEWENGESGFSAIALCVGDTIVHVEDVNGCFVDSTITTTSPTELIITETIIDASCGDSNGEIHVVVSGGVSPYYYTWSSGGSGDGTPDYINLDADNYTLTLTDDYGCVNQESYSVSNLGGPTVTIENQQAPSCDGVCDGVVTISISGGVTPYDIQWSNFDSDLIAEDLCDGVISVEVTGDDGCIGTESVNLVAPIALALSFSKSDLSCYQSGDGRDTVFVIGGTPPYTYSWSNGNSSDIATELDTGQVCVTVTDFNGCLAIACDAISQPTELIASITAQTDATCFGGNDGSLTVTVSGGIPNYNYAWSESTIVNNSPLTTNTINNLIADNYDVTVSDDNGCQDIATATITEGSEIIISGVVTNANCGSSDGSITISIVGGSSPYTTNWSPIVGSGTGTTYPNLLAGPYTVTVEDVDGCTNDETFNVSENGGPTITVENISNVSCNGLCDGEATISATGGTTPYTIEWSSSANTGTTESNLCANTYTVNVEGANGCQSSEVIEITAPDEISLSFTSTNVSCNSLCDGQATVSVSGGTSPYLIEWSTSSGLSTITGLCANVYYVTVSDDHGCTQVDSVEITAPDAITINIVSQSDVLCYGQCNGEALVSIIGGTSPYEIEWDNLEIGSNVDSLCAGITNILVTDANSCSGSGSVTLSQPDSIVISPTITNASCGNSDGSISVVVSGGTTPYTYSWTPTNGTGENTSSYTDLSSSIYNLDLSDGNGCQETYVGSVNDIGGPTITVENISNVSCNGLCDGEATISISGGTTPYSIEWSLSGNTGTTESDLCANTYTVTVEGANGCQSSEVIEITEPDEISLSFTSTNVSCNGLCDGQASVSIIGGTGPYFIEWSTSSGLSTITGLCANVYYVTVSDDNGCTQIDSVEITAPDEITINIISQSDALCYGECNGEALVSIIGGTSPYAIDWENGENGTSADSLCAGITNILVTDANTCSEVDFVNIGEPDEITVTFDIINSNCNQADGAIDATIIGGQAPLEYLWSSGETTEDLLNISAGADTLTVTDVAGCFVAEIALVSDANAGTITFEDILHNLCYGDTSGQVIAVITGGTSPFVYDWGSDSFNDSLAYNLGAGTHNVIVEAIDGCISTASVDITEPSEINISGTLTNVSCFGVSDGKIVLSISGGTSPYTVLWNNAEITTTITDLTAGSYCVTVTDDNGCQKSACFTISAPSSGISISFIALDNECYGVNEGEIDAMISGGTPPYTFLWSSGETTEDINSLYAGVYVDYVTDSMGCMFVDSVEITQPDDIVLSYNIVNSHCTFSDGEITVSATGGNPDYTYLWDSNADDQVAAHAINLSSGTYQLTVTDNLGCEKEGSASISDVDAGVITFENVVHNPCFGDTIGQAIAVITGGASPYLYNWNSDFNDSLAYNLAAGNYTVTITDSGSCVSINSVTITEPNVLDVSFAITDVTCFGLNNGKIVATVTGGTLPYSYTWNPSGNTSTISSLSGDTYYLTVEDAHDCLLSDSALVIEPLSGLTSSIIGTGVLCPSENNGQANLTVSGGTTPYSFVWTSGEFTEDADELTSGWNNVTITDDNGCTKIDSIEISSPLPLSLATTNVLSSHCTFSDGAATIVASGGTPSYSYEWSTGQTTNTVDTLHSGIYMVTVSDFNSCRDSINVLISDLDGFITFTDVQHNPCFGYEIGEATAVISDATAPYTYSWTPNLYTNADSSTYSDLPAGVYFIEILDSSNCLTVDSIYINQPDSTILTFNPTNPTCFGIEDGKIDLTVTGSSTSFSYLWSNGKVIQDIFDLAEDTYTVTVTDGNGCVSVDSVSLVEPTILEASLLNTVDNLCYGDANGVINLAVNGGTPPYEFEWSDNQTSISAINLTAGNYEVTVSDANGCFIILDTAIYQPAEILATFTNNSAYCGSCVGASSVSVSGGISPYTYDWSNDSTNSSISGLCVGFYHLTVTDANACTSTQTIEINDTSSVAVSIIDLNPISCNGVCDASVTVEADGGTTPYVYTWSTPITDTGFSADSLCAGTYYVTVVDDSLCSDAAEIVIQDVNVLSVQLITSNISCNGLSDGSVFAYITGGTPDYSVSWSVTGNDTIISNLIAGTYYLTVSDENNCTFIDSTEVIEPMELTASIVSSDDVTCFGLCNGSATISVAGGTSPYTYLWENDETSQTASALCAGIINVTVTDAGTCIYAENVTILEPAEIVGTFSNLTQVSCNGGNEGTATISVTGGTSPYSYLWNDVLHQDSTTAINLVAGLYTVSVQDFNGCIDTSMIEVIDTSNLSPVVSSITDATCYGNCNGEAVISTTGGAPAYSYIWSTGDNTSTVSDLCAGMHFVTIYDSNLCSRVRIADISSPDPIEVVSEIKGITCNGECDGEITLHASGGVAPFTYHWISLQTPPEDSVSVGLCEGNYLANIQDNNGCLYFISDSIEIITPSLISTSYTTNLTTCENSTFDGDINLTVLGGVPPYTYLWNPDSLTTQDLHNIASGYYSVTISDEADCILQIDSITVNANIIIIADAGPDTSICLGQSVQLFGSGADTLIWTPTELLSDSSISNPFVTPMDSTMFILTAKNVCYDTDTMLVNIYPLLNIEASDDVEIYYDEIAEISVDGGDELTTYYWTPSTGLSDTTIYNPEATPEESTLYYVFTTSQYGCVQHDSVLVSIIPRIKFPTGFTPNDDGINDTWIIDYLDYYPEIEVEIFNRWGESLWYSKGYNQPWDGTTAKGKILPMGTYYYIINVNNDYEKHVISGPVTIMK